MDNLTLEQKNQYILDNISIGDVLMLPSKLGRSISYYIATDNRAEVASALVASGASKDSIAVSLTGLTDCGAYRGKPPAFIGCDFWRVFDDLLKDESGKLVKRGNVVDNPELMDEGWFENEQVRKYFKNYPKNAT